MTKLIAKRVLTAIFQIFIVATIVFAAVHLMPGDPAELALGGDTKADASQIAEMRHLLGEDKPILTQYGDYIGGLLRLDFGKSLTDREPVANSIAQRLPKTIELALVALVLALVIGILLGITSALRRGKFSDLVLTTVSVLGISIPVYVIGTVLILLFATGIHILPAGGYTDASDDLMEHICKIILPALTMAVGLSASITRITRNSLLESLNREYIQTLRAKGLPEKIVIYKHALRNSLIPIVTVVGLQLGGLMGGSVLVENIFNWPGLGKLMVQSVSQRDYTMIEACIIVIAAIFILVNTFVDVLYRLLDPKVR